MTARAWLSENDWHLVQKSVPIACADVLPIRDTAKGIEIGLIYRHTPHQGTRWVTIGGRILLNEPLHDAVTRQMRETLGGRVHCVVADYPIAVVQYFSRRIKGHAYDPRQHAIGLTYAVRLSGRIGARGEALEFRWFSRAELPSTRHIGFGQSRMLIDCWTKLEQPFFSACLPARG
jgi:ADP-ribose pyrophosphatase YjhB (NUDIX family)